MLVSRSALRAEPIVRYAENLLRLRWPVMIVSSLMAALMASGMQHLRFSGDYRYYFSETNPQLQAFDELQDTYTKVDNVLFVVEVENGSVFEAGVLEAIEYLTEEGWRLPFAIRVDSITNFQHTYAMGGDLIVERLIENASTMDAERIAAAQATAIREPVIRNKLLAPDSRTTGVSVTFELPGQSLNEVPHAVAAARTLADDVEAQFLDIRLRLTGTLMLNTALQEAAKSDIASLVPLMYAVIFGLMLVLVRSLAGVIGTVLVVGLAAAGAMGMAGWVGISLTSPSVSAATMIMTLGVADSIHILVSVKKGMHRGLDKTTALVESLRLNIRPIFLTSVTTAIGFLSMNFSDAPPFRDLGNIAAFGVMLAFLLSVTFMPALLTILPIRKSRRGGGFDHGMIGLADFVIRRKHVLLVSIGLVSIVILAQIPRNELRDEFIHYFDDEIEFRSDTDFTIENLTGIYMLQYSIATGSSYGITDPTFLGTLAEFTAWLRAQPEVMHVNSISDVFSRLNQNMHDDDPTWNRLPEKRDLAAQYLLLYELSLPYGLDLNNQINIDKSATQVIVTLGDISSVSIRAIADRGASWLQKNIPTYSGIGSGPAVMFAHITQRNIKSMLVGTMIGLLCISGLLVFALRSFKLGLVSLAPNLLPAGLAFGLWAIVVGRVNMAVSVVAAMTLGIVVDFTVHFISKYLRAQGEQQLDAEGAIRYSFSTVGMALIITTVVLVAGFLVLAQSSFTLNSSMAKLTSITVILAIVIDFLLLPPLLLITSARAAASNVLQSKTKDEALESI